MLGGKFSVACAMCLRTVSEYWKRSPQMRQCHWSRAKMYGRHSGLFGSSLGLGIFKSCKKNRNYHSDRADYDSGDRAGPAACHGFREVAKSGAWPEPAIKWEFLVLQFRSKMETHPAVIVTTG